MLAEPLEAPTARSALRGQLEAVERHVRVLIVQLASATAALESLARKI